MNRTFFAAVFFVVGLMPTTASAVIAPAPQQTAQAPAACERACSQSAAGNCKAGDVTGNPNGDPQCAASRIGVVEFTQLSTFGNAGSCVDNADNNRCASGSCTTWQGKPVYGVAHRTFPFGTQMEVCNTRNGVCQIATVIERGPASYVTNVTVDARAELGKALLMNCNDKIPATYKVLSVPGIGQTAQPSGPAQVSLDALLSAGHIQGNLGNNLGNPSQYTPVNTPYGVGYLGNPTTQPYYAMQPAGGTSPYAAASPYQIGSSGSTAGSVSQAYVPQTAASSYVSNASPYSALTTSNAATQLQAAIQSQTQVSVTSQTIISGAPSISNIVVQPHTASRLGSILISWTSLNMRAGSCAVSLNGNVLAKSEEGSKIVPTQTIPTGTLTIVLTCTSADGTTRESTDTIIVQ